MFTFNGEVSPQKSFTVPEAGVIVKEGNKLKYTTAKGEEIKEFRKGWGPDNLQKVINDFKENDAPLVNNDDIVPEEVIDENE